MREIIFSKYSNERGRSFAIRTDILEENGKRWLEKTWLYPEGKAHVLNMPKWNQKLDQLYSEIPFVSNKCEAGENCVRLEYLEGETLTEYLDDLLERGRKEEAEAALTDYLAKVQQIHNKEPFTVTEEFKKVFGNVQLPKGLTCTQVTNIDMICDNVVLTRPYTLLDYEWTFDFPVPCEFVLYRIIHYYIQTHKVREVLDEEALYRRFGISEAAREGFLQMEKGFQAYLTGSHVPMREMYADMTPGVEYISQDTLGALQIYFAEQKGGYSEQNSVKRPIMAKKVKCTVNLPQNCRFIRIDPGNKPCAVFLGAVLFDGQPASVKGIQTPDGAIYGRWAFLARFDPCIVDIAVPAGAKKLTLKLEVDEGNMDMLNHIRVLEEKNRSLMKKLGSSARKAVHRLKKDRNGSGKKGN